MKAGLRLLLVLALVAPAFASAQTSAKTPAPTCRLYASATMVGYNTKVRLDWQSTNATAGYLTAVGAIAPNGTATVVPGRNTTYAASFSGPGGTIVCRVAVGVMAGGPGTGSGAPYSGGVVNVNGTTDIQGTSINAGPGGSDTSPPVIPTDTGVTPAPTTPGTVNLGGNVVLPTAPSVSSGVSDSGGSGFVGGIVPKECRGKETIANCDLCSLAQLGQNIANFLLGLTIPAAALLFAWAGILYFSSRGNPAQITQAHKVFRTVVIAVVIALSAWILVNTVMNGLIQGTDLRGWDWKDLKCEQTRKARLYNMSLSQYLQSSLPGLSSYTAPTGGTSRGGCLVGEKLDELGFCQTSTGEIYSPGTIQRNGGSGATSCPSGYVFTTDEGGYCQSTDASTPDAWTEACPKGYVYTQEEGGYCVDPNNPDRWVEQDGTGGTASRSAKNTEFNNQLSTACTQLNVDCGIAGRIGANESSGGRNCSTSTEGAAGCMQVLATTACGIDSSISDACGACSASKRSLSAQCAPVIEAINNDPQLGVNLGVQYISNMQNMPALQQYQDQYGECQITAAAYYAGPGAVIKAGGNINNVSVPPGAMSASRYVAKACG